MRDILAIVNRRGGAGKTATAHALGAGLKLKGYEVLFIDLDSQCNLSFDVGAEAAKISSLDILSGQASAADAIQKAPGGDIIPASPNLAAADTIITGTGREFRLREALEPITQAYDYIIIDTPPALGVLTVNALTACSRAIIPAQPEIHSLQGIGLLNEAITAVRKYTNPDIKIAGILITRYDTRTIISRDMKQNLETIAADLKTKVFTRPIRECTAVKEAQAMQTDIFKHAPRSNAAKDYSRLIEELL